MKRELEREKRLPAFSLGSGELELLWERMLGTFDNSQKMSASIKLSLPSEKLEFESFAELRQYGRVRGRVTNFTLRIAQGSRSITVRSGGLFSSIPTVKVEAESEVWCAGAIEAVLSAVRPSHVWYSWFIYAPINAMFFVLSLAPIVISWLLPKVPVLSGTMKLSWFSVVVALGFLSFTKERLLPNATLVFTNELGFIRRYGSELGLILGVVSLILTIITML
jgi:hypothetical protein